MKTESRGVDLLRKWLTESDKRKIENEMNSQEYPRDDVMMDKILGMQVLLRYMCVERNSLGQTFWNHLDAIEYDGMTGIERIIAQAFVHSTASIVEILEIGPNGDLLVKDLYGEKLLLKDKELSNSVKRYDYVLLTYFRLPGYARGNNLGCFNIPRTIAKAFMDSLDILYRKECRKKKALSPDYS